MNSDSVGFLSLVLPVYNEEEIIAKTLHRLRQYFRAFSELPEVVIVCDGCTDETASLAKNQLRGSGLPHQILEYSKNRGKGHAVKIGMLRAHGHYRLYTDADLPTPLSTLESFLPYFERDVPVVIGSRSLPESQLVVPQPWYRRILGKSFTFLANTLLQLSVSDYTCGFKAFREDVARKIFRQLRTEGFVFDAEVLYKIKKSENRLQEIPVTWSHRDPSKVNPWLASTKGLWDLIKIRSKGPST